MAAFYTTNVRAKLIAAGPAFVLLLTVLLAMPGIEASAQFRFERVVSGIPVRDFNGNALDFPFVGGFNQPRPNFTDVDGDGDYDLLLQERKGGLMFFENTGSVQAARYEWRSDVYAGIDVNNWAMPVDIDGDGDFDLFTANGNGFIRYFGNEGSATEADLTMLSDFLLDSEGDPILADDTSIPAFGDIDCDNDLDMLLGALEGTVALFRNDGFDAMGVPIFTLITDRWQDLLILTEAKKGPGDESAGAQRHGANAFTILDIDNDNDQDMFWGDFFAETVYFFENSGTCGEASMSNDLVSYPADDPIETLGFNVPRFADIDGDDDPDFFIGVLSGALGTQLNTEGNFFYFENVGAKGSPEYTQRTKQFISCIDIGRNAKPAFADLDNDGDLDMMIGNSENAADVDNGVLQYFENTGSDSEPAFRLVNTDFVSEKIGSSLAPTFVDIDNDGDYDMFVGEWQGNVNFFENVGDPETPFFSLRDQNFAEVEVQSYSSPTFADIDDDGDFDMFIGDFAGNVLFYRNVGTPEQHDIRLVDNLYFGVDVGTRSSPVFGDIDRDGDLDLLVGSENNGLILYRNVGSAQSERFRRDTTFNLNMVHRQIAPALVDIDNDSYPDLFYGIESGGIVFYANREGVSSAGPLNTVGHAQLTVRVKPNPVRDNLTLRISSSAAVQSLRCMLYDPLGRNVAAWILDKIGAETESTINLHRQSGGRLSPGMYLLQVRDGVGNAVMERVLVRP